MPERSWVRIPATDTQLTIISHLLGVIVLMFEKTKSGSEWALYKTTLSYTHTHFFTQSYARSLFRPHTDTISLY